ncbi:MAG: ferritin [Anaerolineaceae bacterium]|nr:ferritin [Anaerolineaceae bacterium]
MLISKKLNDTLNAQVGNELGASMQYLHIAAYFDAMSLSNFAQFFFMQAQEENEHAMKLLHFILETGSPLQIPAIPQQVATFSSAEEAVGAALHWEKEVTKQIYNLMDIAVADKDYISQRFLDWFVSEQLEEVSSMDNLLNLVKLAGEKNLLMLDGRVMGLRGPQAGAPSAE